MTTIIILCAIGILAILAELVLPGGILGVVGAVCLIVAVGLIFSTYGSTAGLIALVILLILGIATLNFWMKFFHRLPLTKDLLLRGHVGTGDDREKRRELAGQTGIALTDLMPSGHARIDGEKYDVVTEGGSIRKDSEIQVVKSSGQSLIVREFSAPAQAESS